MQKINLLTIVAAAALLLSGCSSTTEKLTASASGKNLNLDGYLLLGEIESASQESGTPQGRFILGRASYKSRRVGIPADQKVPTTGNFKAVKSQSVFGISEFIIEYDFTAGSDQEAQTAIAELEKQRAAAEKALFNTAP